MNTTAFDDASADTPSGGRETGDVRLPTSEAWVPASSDGRRVRSVHFHDPHAPRATTVVPSVFVAVRGPLEQLLLVRRCDSGSWELPGGRVDVGESAMSAALRETAEESGVHAMITGLVGLYTDPEHVVRAVEGSVRQQFVVVFRARASVVHHPVTGGRRARRCGSRLSKSAT